MSLQERTLNCAVTEPRITRLEEGLHKVDEKINVLSNKDSEQMELLAKLDTMVEFMVQDREEIREQRRDENRIREEERKESRAFNKEVTETIKGVNDNLVALNISNKGLEGRVGQLEETDRGSKIDVPHLITRATETLITTGIIGGVVWLLSMYFGK